MTEKIKKIWYNFYFKLTDIKFWFDNNKDEIIKKINTNEISIVSASLLISTLITLI